MSQNPHIPTPRCHSNKNNNSQKAYYLEQLEHIIDDEKQLSYDFTNNCNNDTHDPPTCTRHPRWITFGCIIFSIMLSSTLLLTKSWQSRTSIGRSSGGGGGGGRGDALEGEREWKWPEMDPWKVIALAETEDSEDLRSSLQLPQSGQGQRQQESEASTSPGGQRIKTWDLDDPSLTLGVFLDSPDWKTQSLIPGADFVNLLRVLQPVDHAFFVTLFVNQSPGRMEAAREDGKGMSPKASTMPIHGQHGCGSWIQDYIEYQNGILDETLAPRFTVHACSGRTIDTPSQQLEQEQEQEQEQELGEKPCGDVFSQMIAMTSAFAWSIKESRGFFLRPDQIQRLQDSFQSPVLQQQWSFPALSHRKAVPTVKVDTEEMTTQETETLFGLQDALFSGTDDETVDQVQDRLWSLRSKSRNRASFERILSAPNDPILRPDQSPSQLGHDNQKRVDKAMSPIQMKKLKNDLNSDGVELVLQQDLLPLFVNTTHTLNQFIDLGLPLPERILKDHQARQQSDQQQLPPSIPTSIRAPSAHGSLFSSSSLLVSLPSISHKAITTAFHAATHDSHDISRIQAAPKTFGCLLDILLQPQLDLQHLIHPYATLFILPAVFSIGIFIESDPSSSSSSKVPHSSSWKSMSVDRQKIVDRYLTCARQIAREFAPKRKGQKVVYVVVSEDAGMARVMESQEEWDEEVIIPSWTAYKDRRHRHQSSGNDPSTASTSTKPAPEPMQLSKQQQRVLENWVLSKTDYQVVSDQSDFAKVAVWRTRREGRSIVIRENPALEQFMASSSDDSQEGRGYVDMLDCGTLLNNFVNRD
ncbi:hypothetical protein BG015_001294 [Linnemannia schmuckeri]|uniref:Uncharacterized protein n=1 Tax=Linnemannia schmuckeri TaxID=64567 RepID=A0A9P5S6B0_9FUNG|nr:hypothetical protein BG015_001294 [Linnemannia schmuckeri]